MGLSLARSYLGRCVTVHMDRPLGSRHPEHGFHYPVNYGYLPGVPAPDGDDLDAYVLGVGHAVAEFTGRCIAILHRRDEDDDKLVVVPDGMVLSDDQILTQTHFQEQFHDICVLRS